MFPPDENEIARRKEQWNQADPDERLTLYSAWICEAREESERRWKQSPEYQEHMKKRQLLRLRFALLIAAVLTFLLISIIGLIYESSWLQTIGTAGTATLNIGLGISNINSYRRDRDSEYMRDPQYRKAVRMQLLGAFVCFFIAYMTITGWELLP